MGLIQEFKQFALRGNVMDLAVAVIIGGAFQKIVTSLVNDILMPVFGLVLGGLDFSKLFVALDGASYPTLVDAEKSGSGILRYGSFIQVTIDFLIIAFVIFLVIKLINLRKKTEPPPVPVGPSEEILLLRDIRDSLKR